MHMIPHITLRNEAHIRIELDRRLQTWSSVETVALSLLRAKIVTFRISAGLYIDDHTIFIEVAGNAML